MEPGCIPGDKLAFSFFFLLSLTDTTRRDVSLFGCCALMKQRLPKLRAETSAAFLSAVEHFFIPASFTSMKPQGRHWNSTFFQPLSDLVNIEKMKWKNCVHKLYKSFINFFTFDISNFKVFYWNFFRQTNTKWRKFEKSEEHNAGVFQIKIWKECPSFVCL